MTLDNYQIHYSLIMCRLPIFYPYQKRAFEAYKNRYQLEKKTGYFRTYGKDLQITTMPFKFVEYEKRNAENIPSHVEYQDGLRTGLYAEKSRYWQYVDPNIEDSKSIQNCSSDFIDFIIQDHSGKWVSF